MLAVPTNRLTSGVGYSNLYGAMTVDEIIELAGGVGKLAELLGVSHSAVCDYRRWDRIPVARARTIHEKLGVPLHEIRGDVWNRADNSASTDHAAE